MAEIDFNSFGDVRLPSERLKWVAPARELDSNTFHEEYIDILAHVPHKVDILLRADGSVGIVQGDVLDRLANHPKVGTVIIYGLPAAQRALVRARSALLGLHVRFCESEEELRVLLNKRRSRAIATGGLNLH